MEVWMNGVRVGRMALTPDGLCGFEYDAAYLRTGASISPYFLPLQPGLMVAKRDPFRGGFGVFDDSLPDGWGSLVLDRYLREKGIDPYRLNILERLSLVGSTGRGALEYRPDESMASGDGIPDLGRLAAEAEEILNSREVVGSMETFYRYAGSSGGARPKVFVKADSREWLVKFRASSDPQHVGEVEYHYSLLARRCGIRMPETRLFDGKYFGVERFDRTPQGKVHTVSAAGLLHADYRIPSLDYSVLLKVCQHLTKDIEQVYDLFRLMVFNVVTGNRDDHAKNFSFQLIGNEWKLSPAYDLLPSSGFNGYHTTTVNGHGTPTPDDLMAVGTEVGLQKQRISRIVEEVTAEYRKFISQKDSRNLL